MRYAAALLFGLVAADRSYFAKRQGDNPVANVFATLKPMVISLDQAVLAYQSGPGTDIIAQSKKIAATVKQSVGIVNAQPTLDLTTAGGLPMPVEDFTNTLKKTIDDLVSKKALSVQNGLGPTVYANLEEQLSGAQALASAIQSKMPPALNAVAQELSGKILDVLNSGLAAFKDVSTPSAGGGAGAGAGASGSSPASGSTTSTSGSAGGAGMGLSPAGSSTTVSGSGAGAGSSSSSGMSGGMSSMGGSASGSAAGSASYGASGSYDASSPQTTSARGSSPAVFTGAGASFKPASVFGLVAVAAAVFAL